MDVGSAPVQLQAGNQLLEVQLFNGALYWIKEDSPPDISIMTNYADESDRLYEDTSVSSFANPQALLIVNNA